MAKTSGIRRIVLWSAIVMLSAGTIAAWWFFYHVATMSGTEGWKTYTNTRFGYTLKYPPYMRVSFIGDYEPYPIEELDDPTISAVGGPTTFGIDAYIPSKNLNPEAVTQRNHLLKLSLKELADAVRRNQLNASSLAFFPQETGELVQTFFAGKPAYLFTQTGAFSGPNYGYSLDPLGSAYRYVFVENNSGTRLMIHFLMNDPVTQRIADSFRIL